MKRLEIPDEVHSLLKSEAAIAKKSLRDYAADLLTAALLQARTQRGQQ